MYVFLLDFIYVRKNIKYLYDNTWHFNKESIEFLKWCLRTFSHFCQTGWTLKQLVVAVSYTHLDVYKRQNRNNDMNN